MVAVAEREHVDPTDLDPPIYDAIDTDALDALVTIEKSDSEQELRTVTFTYYGYAITVDSDGHVTLDR